MGHGHRLARNNPYAMPGKKNLQLKGNSVRVIVSQQRFKCQIDYSHLHSYRMLSKVFLL